MSEYRCLFGLIGNPVSHSFSQKYFSQKFANEALTDFFYALFQMDTIGELPDLITKYPNLKGLNVTLPYKESVIPFLDILDETARAVGAVNTIKIEKGKLSGFNTDVFGFEKSLRQFLDDNQLQSIQKALVFGTGGASKAVGYVLKKLKIDYSLVSRTIGKGDFNYAELDEKLLRSFWLIINTTPLGMAPHIDTCPELDYNSLDSNHFLYDLVYNPEKTVFLARGEKQGCKIMNGLPMLHLQAQKAWQIWNF